MYWAGRTIRQNDAFYMFYSARGPDTSGHRHICVARSDSPRGPFTDVAAPLFDDGDDWIDAHVFIDSDGTPYLFCVHEWTNPAVSQSTIHAARLDKDLTRLDGPLKLCLSPSPGWEGNFIVEAPHVIQFEQAYYLMYSANGADKPSYAVGYATAPHPLGPWTKHRYPILSKTKRVSGPGSNAVATSPDGSELFILYHTHQFVAAPSWHRQLAIDRLQFLENAGGPPFLEVVNGPSTTPQPIPSGAPLWPVALSDNFDDAELDRSRWLVFDEEPAYWKLESGELVITTLECDLHEMWTKANNIFLQYAPSADFDITTKVLFRPSANFELAYLVLFQDHDNYIRLGQGYHNGQRFAASSETDAVRTDYRVIENTSKGPTYLRARKKGDHYVLSTSPDGSTWTVVAEYDRQFSELKVGIGAQSPGSGAALHAYFDYFRIVTLPESDEDVAEE